MRSIGVHIRLTTTITEVAQRALALGISSFQCFLLNQEKGTFYKPKLEDEKSFLELRNQFQDIFLHTSYWINLASTVYETHRILNREIEWAKRLAMSAVIIHPGSAKSSGCKKMGIEAIARVLNKKIKDNDEVKIVLENTAHGGLTIGSDLHDFVELLQLLDKPERIWFCIDTAHAYSYGYDLADDKGQDAFFTLIENTIGFERIAVIHLNDTVQQLGSKIDHHDIIGKGNIGKSHFIRFAQDPRLAHVPLIMELPVVSQEQEKEIVDEVKNWFKESR